MTNTLENRHRQRKRKIEMEIAIQRIGSSVGTIANRTILEFGSGDGYQIPYLRRLGNLVASDIYQSEKISENYPEVNFVICDIRNAPFVSGSFDLIFANHVLEHIEKITKAFSELQRIGKSDCVYIFTVPTGIWLLLSLPTQFYNGVRKLFNRIAKRRIPKPKGVTEVELKGWRRFLPRGHGWNKDFFDCFNSFRIKNWQNLFCENDFKVIEMTPLLLYAPSEFPIIPTTRFLVKKGIYSSAIFLMKKGT